jgi:ABC-type uncharacterized transport system substrate-binding protein
VTADKIASAARLSGVLAGCGVIRRRILRGSKPDELPVQVPTKLELVVNLKTAKELGLDIPPAVIARANDVIE